MAHSESVLRSIVSWHTGKMPTPCQMELVWLLWHFILTLPSSSSSVILVVSVVAIFIWHSSRRSCHVIVHLPLVTIRTFSVHYLVLSDNQRLTTAGLAIRVEDVAFLAPADVRCRNCHTVVLAAVVAQITEINFWGNGKWFQCRAFPVTTHPAKLQFPSFRCANACVIIESQWKEETTLQSWKESQRKPQRDFVKGKDLWSWSRRDRAIISLVLKRWRPSTAP